jgi:hypothetical protein
MGTEKKHTLSDHLTLEQQEALFECIQERLDAHESTIEFHNTDEVTVAGDADDPNTALSSLEEHMATVQQELFMYENLSQVKKLLEE